MKNPRFSIGYNFDYEGFRYLTEKYGKNLDSVYFPIPKKHLGSGRILDEPPAYKKEIIGLIKLCQDRGITSIMLLNSTVVSAAQIKKSVSYLKKLVSRTGLFNVAVTDPYLTKIIKKTIPNINIEASTLARIRTVQEAKYFKELGASKITPDREIMRSLKTLIKIKEILPIKILANEGCIKNCIHRYAHYNMLSSQIIEKNKHYDRMDQVCVPIVSKHPHKVFSAPFIRPEDLYRYKKITNVFKISTRNFDTKRIEKTLKAYISQRFEGNLVDILNCVYIDTLFNNIDNKALNSTRFFETISSCSDDCGSCDYCKKLLKKANVKMKRIRK
ncbi:hypothetical protein GOV08_04730 [Candidatus Woesearchaeota archaeon]|nr:hypothetical protein [Candidatus Woesearchaeota archaeon]